MLRGTGGAATLGGHGMMMVCPESRVKSPVARPGRYTAVETKESSYGGSRAHGRHSGISRARAILVST